MSVNAVNQKDTNSADLKMSAKQENLTIPVVPDESTLTTTVPSLTTDQKGRDVTVKFRWYTTFPTKAASIFFNCPFSKVPISLDLTNPNKGDVFECRDMIVPCGTFKNCTLSIDSLKHVLEVVEIKHYSFEIDLYIDENDEEEAKRMSSLTNPINSSQQSIKSTSVTNPPAINSQISINPHSRISPLNNASAELIHSANIEIEMDDIIEDDDDIRSEKSSTGSIRRLNTLESLLRQQIAGKETITMAPVQYNNSASLRGSREKLDGQDGVKMRKHSDESSSSFDRNVSANLQPLTNKHQVQEANVKERRFEPIRPPSSIRTSSRQDGGWPGACNDVIPDSSLSSFVSEPELQQFAVAVRKNELKRNAIGIDRNISGSSRRSVDPTTTTRDNSSSSVRSRSVDTIVSRQNILSSVNDSTTSLSLMTPQWQEMDLTGGTRSDSTVPFRSSPLSSYHSLSSSQRIENRSQEKIAEIVVESGGSIKKTIFNKDRTEGMDDVDDFARQPSSRHYSAAPSFKSPLVTPRMTPIGAVSSRMNVAAVTHVPLVGGQKEVQKDDLTRQQEQLDVHSLKKLLNEKNNEIEGLEEEKLHLQSLLVQANRTSAENEDKRNKELIREKENLATQLWKLKQDLERHGLELDEKGVLSGDVIENRSIKNYTTNSPAALQRKLDDLHSHLQDLQEANEAASSKLDQAELTIGVLRNENNALRTANENSIEELRNQNVILKEQLQRLGVGSNSSSSDVWSGSTEILRQEIQVLREDLRALRDKNHNLVQDNIKLTEYIKDLKELNGYKLEPKLDEDYADNVRQSSWPSKKPVDTEFEERRLTSHRRVLQSLSLNRTLTPHNISQQPSTTNRILPNGLDDQLLGSNTLNQETLMNRKWQVPRYSGKVGNTSFDVNNSLSSDRIWINDWSQRNISSSHPNLKMTADSFVVSQDADLDLVPMTSSVGEKPDIKRLSICSTSTENILMEADFMLSRSRTSKQKLSSMPSYNDDQINLSSSSFPLNNENFSLLNNPLVSKTTAFTPADSRNNKGTFIKENISFNSCSKKPFAPRNPNEVSVGDLVKFSRNGGHISKGQVKFIGHLPGKSDTYLGVELENEMGKHDGVFERTRYFQCKPNKGVFVAFSKVVMAWCD